MLCRGSSSNSFVEGTALYRTVCPLYWLVGTWLVNRDSISYNNQDWLLWLILWILATRILFSQFHSSRKLMDFRLSNFETCPPFVNWQLTPWKLTQSWKTFHFFGGGWQLSGDYMTNAGTPQRSTSKIKSWKGWRKGRSHVGHPSLGFKRLVGVSSFLKRQLLDMLKSNIIQKWNATHHISSDIFEV